MRWSYPKVIAELRQEGRWDADAAVEPPGHIMALAAFFVQANGYTWSS